VKNGRRIWVLATQPASSSPDTLAVIKRPNFVTIGYCEDMIQSVIRRNCQSMPVILIADRQYTSGRRGGDLAIGARRQKLRLLTV
jgi:hypothetical protein